MYLFRCYQRVQHIFLPGVIGGRRTGFAMRHRRTSSECVFPHVSRISGNQCSSVLVSTPEALPQLVAQNVWRFVKICFQSFSESLSVGDLSHFSYFLVWYRGISFKKWIVQQQSLHCKASIWAIFHFSFKVLYLTLILDDSGCTVMLCYVMYSLFKVDS